MSELLYLDTARRGRMSPSARLAHHAFTDLASEEGGSAYYERFLRGGLERLPTGFQSRYPGLLGWRGIAHLKATLRRLAGNCEDLPVLIANRSAQLMKLAARILFNPCLNVLTTDLDWPAYSDILTAECHRANRSITVLPVRQAVFEHGISEEELIERARSMFVRNGCDGLFLTAVSSDGIHLPVDRLVRALESTSQVKFIAVEGAQDFAHVGCDLRCCDLYLTGVHKWVGAYHPLGVGFYGRRRSKGRIETILRRTMSNTGGIDDPLLHFSARLESDSATGRSETVSVASLFSCQGAVDDRLSDSVPVVPSLTNRLALLGSTAALALNAGWKPILPEPPFRSGILLLHHQGLERMQKQAEQIRDEFRDHGVSLSAFEGGTVRLSMPPILEDPRERDALKKALCTVASGRNL